MCSARVNPLFVIEAFQLGADGVIVSGCHPGDCQYVDGNYKAEHNYEALYKAVLAAGIEEERIHLEWISASEGIRFQRVVTEFVNQLETLPPNPLKGIRLLEHQQHTKSHFGAEEGTAR
jgi:coenzyme F420-reducing hydrogenase delta subunit